MKKIFILLINLTILTTFLFGQDYLWPTNAGKILSSTFGEYRDGHFHSGIDFKTNLETGYPVYAIDDGYISRMLTSPFGYGKAVYLKLKDGNIAVYGHLDRFSSTLQIYVRKKQESENRYSTNQYFEKNQIPVKKGDIIAYTGDTGTKHPHLHFEVRDANQQPINPLNFNYKIKDSTVPTIKAIAIIPLDTMSRINHNPRAAIFPARYNGERKYRLDEKTIQVFGPVGLEIKTFDTINGLYNKYGPYGIRLLVDDSLYFSSQCDTFNFAKTSLIEIDRDLQLKKNGEGRFIRLWNFAPDHHIPFRKSNQSGRLELMPGFHVIKIQVYDKNLNTSTLEFTIYSGFDSQPLLKKFKKTDSGYYIELARDSLHIYRNISAVWENRFGHQTEKTRLNNFTKNDSVYIFTIAKKNPASKIIKLIAKPIYNAQDLTLYLETEGIELSKNFDLTSSYIHNPYTYLCSFEFNQAPLIKPCYYLQMEDELLEIPLIRESSLKYITLPVPLSVWNSSIQSELHFKGKPQKIFRKNIDLYLISKNNEEIIHSRDSLLSISFGSHSVFNDVLVSLKIEDTNLPDIDKLESHCYNISPKTQPMDEGMLLEFSYLSGTEDLQQLGIYRKNVQDNLLEWEYSKAHTYFGQHTISATVDEFGCYALVRDNDKPIIENIYPGDGGKFKVTDVLVLRANVYDELSGVKDDASFTVTLDGEPLITEYHAIQKYIKYKLEKNLSIGEHRLSITVEDQAMNRTVKTSTFQIIRVN